MMKIYKIYIYTLITLLFSLNAFANTYTYEFDISQAKLSQDTYYKPTQTLILVNNKPFTSVDRLLLEIDTTNKTINLFGKNNGIGTCIQCPPANSNEYKFTNGEFNFGVRIFDYSDWIKDGNASGKEKSPINFSNLEANPGNLYGTGIWNYDSPWANRIAETAGSAAVVSYKNVDGGPAGQFFTTSEIGQHILSNSTSYLISSGNTFFNIQLASSIGGNTSNGFSISGVGSAHLLNGSSAVPEPMSLALLSAGALGLINRKKS